MLSALNTSKVAEETDFGAIFREMLKRNKIKWRRKQKRLLKIFVF